jgi:hypothetical protein
MLSTWNSLKGETMSNHTIVPWHLIRDKQVSGTYYVWPQREPLEGKRIAIAYGDANAYLIAAAPELLSALKRMIGCPDVNLDELSPETLKALDDANNAIAKAEGRTNRYDYEGRNRDVSRYR